MCFTPDTSHSFPTDPLTPSKRREEESNVAAESDARNKRPRSAPRLCERAGRASGQSMVEYVLILSLLVWGVVFTSLKLMAQTQSGAVGSVTVEAVPDSGGNSPQKHQP